MFSGDVDIKEFEQYNLVNIPYRCVQGRGARERGSSKRESPSKHQIDLQTQRILMELNRLPNKDVIVLLNVEEESGNDSEEAMLCWCDYLTSHLNSHPSVNYIILTNDTFEHADNYSRVFSVNWFLHEAVCLYSQTEIIPWEPTNTDILFLPGKPWKPSRFPALYYFLRSSFRSNLKYSSLTFEDMMEWHADYSAQKLVESWNLVYGERWESPNEIKIIMNKIAQVYDMPWGVGGKRDFNRLHPKMYSNICAEIISETAHNNEKFITEKTYKPIVLGYPFVFIHNNFLKTILGQGFKIFQPVLGKEFDGLNGVRDWEKEFETCVKNTEKVVNNTQNEILKDTIKWNQQHAMILHQETINNIAIIIPNFNNYAEEIFCQFFQLQKENT